MSSENGEGSGPSELELLKTRARMIGVEFSNNIGVDTLRERVAAKMAELDGDDGEAPAPAEAPAAESDTSIPEVVDTAQSEDAGEGGDEADLPVEDFDADIEEDEAPAPEAQPNGFTAAAQIAAAKVTVPPSTEIKPIPRFSGNAPVDPGHAPKVGQPIAPKANKKLTLRQYLYNEQMKLVRLRIQNLDPKKADLNGEVIAISNKYLGTVKVFVPYGEVTDDGWHVPYIIYKELERRRFLSIRTVKDPRTKQPVVKKGWAKEFALDILPPLSSTELAQLATAQAAAGSIDSGNSDLL